MKFYKYWARGEATVNEGGHVWKLRAYGGSNVGLEDALQRANEISARAAVAVEQGQPARQYVYSRSDVREEVIREFSDANGILAVITRNALGCLVLNTSRVMFVDVDYPRTGLLRTLWYALRRKRAAADIKRDERLLRRFNIVVSSRPGLGLRIYRTAAGYRLLVTSHTYDPVSSDAVNLLAAFGSDPLYLKLCKVQECFRARLSAKPWRCGLTVPPTKFPWLTPEHEARYRKWEEQYHATANKYATCELVGSLGMLEVSPDVQSVLETHDRLTMQSGAALA